MSRFEEPEQRQAEFIEVKEAAPDADPPEKSGKVEIEENKITENQLSAPAELVASSDATATATSSSSSSSSLIADDLSSGSVIPPGLRRRKPKPPVFIFLALGIFAWLVASFISNPVWKDYLNICRLGGEGDPKLYLENAIKKQPDLDLRMHHAILIEELEPAKALAELKEMAAAKVRDSNMYRQIARLQLKKEGYGEPIAAYWRKSLEIAGDQGKSPFYWMFPGYSPQQVFNIDADNLVAFRSVSDLLVCGDYKYIQSMSDAEFVNLHLRPEQTKFFRAIALREAGKLTEADKLFAELEPEKIPQNKLFRSTIWAQARAMRVFCALDRGDLKEAYRLERLARKKASEEAESEATGKSNTRAKFNSFSWVGSRVLNQASAWIFFEKGQYKVALGCLKEAEDKIRLDAQGMNQTFANQTQSEAALHYLRSLIYAKMGDSKKAALELKRVASKKTGCDGRFFMPKPYRQVK